MDTPTPTDERSLSFRHPKRYFSDVDAALAARIVSSGVDVALVIIDGVIKDIALGSASLVEAGCDEAWRGKAWRETVTPESLGKIEDLLQVAPKDRGRWRQVTQLTKTGNPVPIKYTTVHVGKTGRILALGQDLSSLSTMQQRLVAMHQDLEREYASLRDAETRYRHLFNALSEPVLIVNVADGSVAEVNPAARRRLGLADDRRTTVTLWELLPDAEKATVQRMIDRALTKGSGEAQDVRFRRRGSATLRATAFRQGNDVFAIIRIEPDGLAPPADPAGVTTSDLRHVMENLPDGLVVTTSTLRILSANATFLSMVQAVDDRQIVGDQLSNWLGRSAVELSMLQSNLSRRGVARNFATVIRDRFGVEDEVEVSAVAAELDTETVFGFAIRSTSRRMAPREGAEEWLPGRAEQVTSLVGQVPLKEIVKASTDLIEKLCIETALEISHDSRASAAEILGLSRQGLYSKLKRFGLADSD